MSFRNNQMFQRPNQFQASTPQAFNQQQQLGNVRFTTNTSTARMQNMFNPLQTSVQAGMPPWGAGVAVQAGQQNFQPQIIQAGLQNPAMANMTNPQQNAANMMGLLANQQLLAQAAGLVATPGLGVGMQVPFTGQGILGAGPMRGQLPQVFQNVGQTGLGNSGQYSPKSNMNQRNSKSSNQNRGRQSNDRSSGNKDQRSFDRSRSDNRGSRDQSKDRKIREDKKDPRREDRRGDQKSNRVDDQRNFDQRDSKNIDRRRDGSRDNRKYDLPDDRRSDFREDRKNRNDRNIDRLDDRRDVRKDDKSFLRKDESKRDDKSGDKRKPFSDRKDIDRRSAKGDNRNKGECDRSKGDNDRSRDFGRRSNQGSRSRRDDDLSDNASSPDKKRTTRTKDGTKASTSSKKSKPEDQESYSEVEDTIEDVIEEEIPAWLRCSPSDLYFTRDNKMIKDTTLIYACLGGRDLHVGLDCDEFHLVPGAIVSQLTVEAAQRAVQIPGHKTVYFIAGIPDLLTTLTSPGYEETIFEDQNLFDTFYGQMRQTELALKLHNCHVVFSTISSMSLREYNENNKKMGKTYTLRFEKDYPEMQENLHRLLKQINSTITAINTKQKLLTPFIHSHVNKWSTEKNKTVYRLNKLLDGLNPCGTIVDGWRITINKTILKNKIMMSKPDFNWKT